MGPRYTYKAVTVRSGRVVENLPLVEVSAQCRLDFGRFSAKLPTQGRPLTECRKLVAATTPGIMTVLVLRDGKVMGEWMLWSRGPRENGSAPFEIAGLEFGTWLQHVVVAGWSKMAQVDQLVVASQLAQLAVDNPGAPAELSVAFPALSGNTISEADYPTGTEYVGAIMSELAAAVDGFDWWVDSRLDPTADTPTVIRTIRFGYPRRGQVLNARIRVPAVAAGAASTFSLTEDATKIATTVYMTGTGEGDKQLYSRGLNADLLRSYPALEVIDSRASYDQQDLLDAQAQATAAAARSPELPNTVSVRADGDLALGTYQPGDIVPINVDACNNFPDGYDGSVRILGYTMNPPADGDEFVDVEIERAGTGAFSL